ncbi:hypothetical protein FHW94_001989 [Novosphingobium sp. SG720]|nr:hypothetical protein [Novosphingobium sp. SG720]
MTKVLYRVGRCATSIGADAYAEAGGGIINDPFSEDRGGYFEVASLRR